MKALLALLGLGAAAIVLGGRKSVDVLQGIVVDIPDVKLPPPDDFRSGAMPDPSAPGDPNRGRYFGEWSSSDEEGTSTLHSATLLSLASDARGTIEVKVWLTRKGEPARCTLWAMTSWVIDGRIEERGVSLPSKCGSLHAGWLEQLGDASGAGSLYPGRDGDCIVDIGVPTWEQRGSDVGMLLGIGVRDRGNPSSSHDCKQEPTFYIDALWRYRPTPVVSGATRG